SEPVDSQSAGDLRDHEADHDGFAGIGVRERVVRDGLGQTEHIADAVHEALPEAKPVMHVLSAELRAALDGELDVAGQIDLDSAEAALDLEPVLAGRERGAGQVDGDAAEGRPDGL